MRVRLKGIRECHLPTEEECTDGYKRKPKFYTPFELDRPSRKPEEYVLIGDFVTDSSDFDGFTLAMTDVPGAKIGDEFEVVLHPLKNEA